MDLHQLQEILQKYREGTATREETRLVEAWFLKTEEAPAFLSKKDRTTTERRILNKLRAAIGTPVPVHRTMFQLPLIRIAAMLIVLLGAGFTGYQYRYQLLDYFDPVEMITAGSGVYNIEEIVLPDGSVVTLAPNSKLVYPQKYRGRLREVSLTGKGYFIVTRNPAQPFLVHTGNIDVQVLGTSFVITDLPKDSVADVTVLTGKVNVLHQKESLTLLSPDQVIRFNKTSKQAKVDKVDAAGQIGWVEKRLLFEATALSDVLKALEAQYDVVIQSPAGLTEEKVFTGEFTVKDSLKDILDIITISTGLKYQQQKDSIIKIYR